MTINVGLAQRDGTTSATRPEPLVNDNNHGLLATVAVAFSLTMIGLTLIIRMMIRWPASRMFGRDDAANLVAVFFSIVQSVIILAAVQTGFGRRGEALDGINQPAVEKLVYAGDVFYVVTLFSSKMIVAFLFDRIAGFKEYRPYTLTFGISSVTFTVISILLVAIGPSAVRPWLKADSRFIRWTVVEVMGILLDVAIVAFPILLLWDLRMTFSKKFWIAFGFAARLPLIALAGLRLWAMKRSLDSTEFLFEYVTTEIISQVEQCYSVLCATIPCLGILLLGANSGMLPVMVTMTSSAYSTGKSKRIGNGKGSSGKGSSGKGSSSKGTTSRTRSSLMKDDIFELTDRSRGQTTATATREKRSMESDKSRRAILVRQTIDVQYESNHEGDEETIGESATDLRLT